MRRILVLAAVVGLVATACGGDGSTTDGGGEAVERTVLIDYKHDEFASAFLRYYPETIKVRPGDTVRFKQAWTGEAHSVTMGKVVDEMMANQDILTKYDSEEEAAADGVTPEKIAEVLASFNSIPGMVGDGFEIDQPGARPCYIDDVDDVPLYSDPETERTNEDAECPPGSDEQPAFTGRQGLYNSGFIPPDGDSANTFVLPVAEDADPGTYKYFCNLHWVSMSGTVEVVDAGEAIPTQDEVNRQARREIARDATVALERMEEAKTAQTVETSAGKVKLPLAGREADEDFAVIINEFLPRKVEAEVGKPVTWTVDGVVHTVSFNVPKYFPIFTVEKSGDVTWNPQAYEPVGWDLPKKELSFGPSKKPALEADVGRWDGTGGFHSSGALEPGDTFTVTFTRAGTYPFACVLHPQMVGTITVKD